MERGRASRTFDRLRELDEHEFLMARLGILIAKLAGDIRRLEELAKTEQGREV